MTTQNQIVRALAIIAMGITLIACGPGGSTQIGGNTDNLTITVGNVPATVSELTTTLTLNGKQIEVTNTVTPNMSRPILVTAKVDPSFTGTVSISVNALNGGTQMASATGSVSITAGGNAHAELTLTSSSPPDMGGNPNPDMAQQNSCTMPAGADGWTYCQSDQSGNRKFGCDIQLYTEDPQFPCQIQCKGFFNCPVESVAIDEHGVLTCTTADGFLHLTCAKIK